MMHFVLKRKAYGWDDIYKALKTGKKKSEWRDATRFWQSRILTKQGRNYLCNLQRQPIKQPTYVIPEKYIKHTHAKFVVGYTKTPALITKVLGVIYHPKTEQFQVRVKILREVTE